jgi:L-malate glycosyltransferase
VKILYTCCQPGYAGGTGRYVQILFEHFSQKHNVFLAVQKSSSLYADLTGKYGEKIIDMDYPLEIKRLPELFEYFLGLFNLIKQKQFDIIHCNGKPDHKMVTLVCSFFGKKPKIIYTQHESHRVKKNFFTKKRLKSTAQIILTCDQYKRFYTDVGVKESRLSFIPNGVDTDYFSPGEINRREVGRLKALYQIEDGDTVFGSIGTASYKGWHYLTRAVSRLEVKKDIKVILIGGLPAKEAIERDIVNLGLKENVIFTGLQKDVRSYVALSDVCFLLSDSVESFSFALREMMALGKPVIVSDYGCLPYDVEEGSNGYIVPVGDIEELRGLIGDIHQNKTGLIHMGLRARQKAEREFNVQVFLAKTDRIYHQIIKEEDRASGSGKK